MARPECAAFELFDIVDEGVDLGEIVVQVIVAIARAVAGQYLYAALLQVLTGDFLMRRAANGRLAEQ